jgi:AraC-like DNA-binding protein
MTAPPQRSISPEDVLRDCSAAFYPHDMELLDRRDRFDVTFRVGVLGPITFGDVVYDTPISLDFRELGTAYQISIPLAGEPTRARHRGHDLPAAPTFAPVFQPTGRTVVVHWPAHTRSLGIKIDKALVDRALGEVRGGPALDLLAGIDLATAAGRGWADLAVMASSRLADDDSLLRHPLVAGPLAESLVNGFLLAASPAYAALTATPVAPAPPASLRRAVDLIEADPGHAWTTQTLAWHSHLGVRALQSGFRRHYRTTPMEYVRTTRLRAARRALSAAHHGDVTVAAVAHRWGFTHLGRFAADYQRLHGELPSDTLKRSR